MHESNYKRRSAILSRVKVALSNLDPEQIQTQTQAQTSKNKLPEQARSESSLAASFAKNLNQQFLQNMTGNSALCFECQEEEIPALLHKLLVQEKIKSLVLSGQPQVEKIFQQTLNQAQEDTAFSCDFFRFENNLEELKERLFEVAASLEKAHSGLAETGSLVIRSTKETPRSLSLIPPIHIVLLSSKNIYANFETYLSASKLSSRSSLENTLLISGPSKTADIELTLVQGIHGPLKLIVILYNEAKKL